MSGAPSFTTVRRVSGVAVVKSLDNRNLTTIPPIPGASKVTELRLQGNRLKNFTGLPRMDRLEVLRLDNTEITSFIGACEQPNLRAIILDHTPLASFAYFRVMTLMVFGPQLETIGQKPITAEERRLAQKLDPQLREFLLKGWLLTSLQPARLYNTVTHARRVFFAPQSFEAVPTIFEPEKIEDPLYDY